MGQLCNKMKACPYFEDLRQYYKSTRTRSKRCCSKGMTQVSRELKDWKFYRDGPLRLGTAELWRKREANTVQEIGQHASLCCCPWAELLHGWVRHCRSSYETTWRPYRPSDSASERVRTES
uniref:Uncharacterized protein n=1 Tax=Knipowitschia caucasica TaxID=637954 RepID=A0AAV2J8K3_KNICA